MNMTRKSTIALLAGILLTGCASAPNYISPDDYAEARLRDLRNAEARLKLARTVIDLDEEADADDLREFYAARDALSALRSEYGPTETGYDDLGWHPLGLLRDGNSTVPRTIAGD